MPYELKRDDVYGLASVLHGEVHEKGEELFFRYCPYCHGGGHDRDTFSVNLKTGVFHCFRSSCGKSGHFVELARDFDYPLDFGNGGKRYRKLPQNPVEVREPAIRYLEKRGISRETALRYHVTTRKDDPGILVFPFYDEAGVLRFLKYRRTDFDKTKHKSKEWCEAQTQPILFGMDQCVDFHRLVITEGQLDSLSVAEAGVQNAVSVPNGCNGFTFLEHVWDWVVKFDEVVVFGDNENGRITLADTLQKRLPNRVKVVDPADYLGEKDANDLLRAYGKEAVRRAVERAKCPPVSHVKSLSEVRAVEMCDLPRIKTGIPELEKLIGGLFFGQVVLLTGKRGEGKSTFLSQLLVEALEQGYRVFAYSGELPDYLFKGWVDFQAAGPQHIAAGTTPSGETVYRLKPGVVRQIERWYDGRAFLYDSTCCPDAEEDLIATIEQVVRQYGVKFVCVDNLMTAMDGSACKDLYQAQSEFVRRLKQIAVKEDVAILLVAHPRKNGTGSSADDVSGSGDITNRVDVVLSYSRNPAKTGETGCDSHLTVSKNRLFGRLSKKPIELFYSRRSRRITSEAGFKDGPRRYGWERMVPEKGGEFIPQKERMMPHETV